MLDAFKSIKNHISFKVKPYRIDNLFFRLHYRFTCLVLLACCILVCSRQYIGEHIHCITGSKGVAEHVMNTFCYFNQTYSLVRYFNATLAKNVPHPGVAADPDGNEPRIVHAYYQWVPFVLFGQAILFYLPHLVWKNCEGKRVESMTKGIKNAALASQEASVHVNANCVVPSKSERNEQIAVIRTVFADRLNTNKLWALRMFGCELLNTINVLMQIWLMNSFLAGRFMSIGALLAGVGDVHGAQGMEIIFPKVTKCTFYKYGTGGGIEVVDAMCVMALNVINEKIYVFLWFWFIFLIVVSVVLHAYRILAAVLQSRNIGFNRFVFAMSCSVSLDEKSMRTMMEKCDFSDWLFLHYLADTLDDWVFRDLLDDLATELVERKTD